MNFKSAIGLLALALLPSCVSLSRHQIEVAAARTDCNALCAELIADLERQLSAAKRERQTDMDIQWK